jgi:hypothetical protein
MDDKHNNSQQTTQQNEQPIAQNPNPRANENIRVRSEEQQPTNNEDEVGSEITDGEDA